MERADIRIVTFEYIDAELLLELQQRLYQVLPRSMTVKAETALSLPIPGASFNARRSQYLATTFLDALEQLPLPGMRVIGVANVDLYAPDLRYVFGQARILGREGIISLARLRQEYYGKSANRELLLQRARVEAVHELGHTFGLEHCFDHHCAMFLSNGIAHTDRKADEYCAQCRAELASLIDRFLRQSAA
ncbi:MAG: archaemetzincin family Zn-dependent metalloprotease [Chloroflexi bacterium]|nr:archaemetzincin family Zn-dependent metalloprotease [Chloroflexota bacterium]